MKWILIIICFYSYATYSDTIPAQKSGVGVILGEPTGFTVKYWKNQERAVDAGLAFSFDEYMLFYSDYLIQFKPIKKILPYAGIGGEILFSTDSRRDGRRYYRDDRHDTELGIRIPVGAEWMPPDYPIGLFAEIVPGFAIVPDVFGILQAGVGGRYYF